MNHFTMYVPTKLIFGAGTLNELSRQSMPGKKAMIIISNGKSTRANGYLSRTEEQLALAGIESIVYDKVQPNPLKSTVMDAAQVAKNNHVDFLVALGGGSVIDSTKAIAMMATNPGDLWDYVQSGTGKGMPLQEKPLPFIAISTTSGTGSEVDWSCVITNEDTNEKTGTGSIATFPVFSIEDTELMLSVPPDYTAYQGFDALTHSMEGYITKVANPMSDMYAITAIENIARYLARAVKDGSDMEAREHVAFGNVLSGSVMCVGSTSSQHSLEHAMSAYHPNLPHGAGLIMLFRAYFSFFINKHVCDDRFIRMAKAMGKDDASSPMDFITVLEDLLKACNVSDLKMSDYGITPDEFPIMADNALDAMGFKFEKDRYKMTREEVISIYEAAYR